MSSTRRISKPDFLATRDNEQFVVEAIWQAQKRDAGSYSLAPQLNDAIDRLPSPNFFVSCELHSTGTATPPQRRLKSGLTRWLASLDPDQVIANPRLPGWGLVEVLVAELARRLSGGAPVEHEVKRFHDRWDTVAAEDFSGLASALSAAIKAAVDSRDYSEAIRLGTQSLAASTWAQDHPQNLERRHHLAHWRGDAGEAAEAAAAIADLMQDQARVQGPDHPDTLEASPASPRQLASSSRAVG
ncbi:hypothetical protein AB0K49_12685 [Streptomyces decoyicus]|uniref:hypothetical protein n=1 Tax=Streptomyces decoyicus TaxID=249567 RepID=UPI00345D5BB9